MPPRRPNLTAIGQATSTKVQFNDFPRLWTPFIWSQFLVNLLATSRNRKAFARCEHADVVELLRRQANEQFRNDSERLKIALAEITAKGSEDAWAHARAQTGGARSGLLRVEVAKLNIPAICTQGHREEMWRVQKYSDFAQQAERKNPVVTFAKDSMDVAFEIAVSRLSVKALGNHKAGGKPTTKDAMTSRCLGKESKDYWKNRE